MTNKIKVNATIGSGKVVHGGYFIPRENEENYIEYWYSNCGADHATNRSRVSYRITDKPITCKKCLKNEKK